MSKSPSQRKGAPSTEPDKKIKIVLVGDSGVGKTRLVSRIANNTYDQSDRKNATLSYFNTIVSLEVDGQRVQVELWDTVSNHAKSQYSKMYFRRAAGVILMYDVTDRASFESLQSWLSFVGNETLNLKMVNLAIVGNKIDDQSSIQVNSIEGREFAQARRYKFYEVSCKTGAGTKQFFKSMAEGTQCMNSDTLKHLNEICIKVSETQATYSPPKKLVPKQRLPPKKKWCC